jgi:hypothetical protein
MNYLKSGYTVDAFNANILSNSMIGTEVVLHELSSDFKINVKLYEIYNNANVIQLPTSLSPGLLAKKIILGEISNDVIAKYVKIFTDRFEEFEQPNDVPTKDYLLRELATNFYRFHANPAIWIYKTNTFVDVKHEYITEKRIENDSCEIIITKISNFLTLYDILLLNITLEKLKLYYPDICDNNVVCRYQQLKYKIMYNYDLYPLEKLTNGLFIVKKKYFYYPKDCCIWGQESDVHVTYTEKTLLTLMERFSGLHKRVIEI